jgi:predicted nucleic acid-binding protein
MRALIDTNILLDLILEREPFVNQAEALWEANRIGQFDGLISALSPATVFYVVRKAQQAEKALQAVADLLSAFEVCPLTADILRAALALSLRDYEDAVQLASGLASRADVIVTRDSADFADAPIPVLSPSDFLARLTTA